MRGAVDENEPPFSFNVETVDLEGNLVLRPRNASAEIVAGRAVLSGAERDGWCVVTGRPRHSTLVLSGLFLAVLALYLWVRPVPVSTAPASQAPTPTPQPSVTRSSSPSPVPRRTSLSPTPTTSPTSSHPSSPASPTPSQSPPQGRLRRLPRRYRREARASGED